MSCIHLSTQHTAAVACGVAFMLNGAGGMDHLSGSVVTSKVCRAFKSCMLTLYFSCCTPLRGSLGVCASCQTVLLFRFLDVTCAPHRGRMFSFVLPDFPVFRLVIISCQPPTWPDVPIVDSTFTSVPCCKSGSCYICNLGFRKPAVQIFRQERSISRDSSSIRQIHNVPYRVCITVHHSGWLSCLRNAGRELLDSGHKRR